MSFRRALKSVFPSESDVPAFEAIVVPGLFFSLFLLFTWHWLDPQLIYHGDEVVVRPESQVKFPSFLCDHPWTSRRQEYGIPGQTIHLPLFQWGTRFLAPYLAKPGGLAQYTAAWACQQYHSSLSGALILTTVAVLMYAGTYRLIQATRTPGRSILPFVAPLLLLSAFNRYTFRLGDYVALTVALLAANTYHVLVRAYAKQVASKIAVFTGLSLVVYYVVGSSYLLFAALCGLLELIGTRRRFLAVLYFLAAAVIPFCGHYLLLVSQPGEAFRLSGLQRFQGVLHTAIPSVVYLLGAIVVLLGTSKLRPSVTSQTQNAPPLPTTVLGRAFPVLLLAIASPLVAFGTLNEDTKSLLRANYFARNGMWPDVLREIDEHPPTVCPPTLACDLYLALFKTGELGNRLFSLPQFPEFLVRFGPDAVSYRSCYDVLLELGCVNQAEHTLHEALEVTGERPYVLRQLVVVNVAKGRRKTAKVFLNVLCKDVIYRRWAQDYLRRLEQDDVIPANPQLERLGSLMVRKDSISTSTEELLQSLLARNDKNRMAFEYLMTHDLLTNQLGKAIQNTRHLRAIGYERIPEHYAEAILLHSHLTGREPDLYGYTIEKQTRDRFRDFLDLVEHPRHDPKILERVGHTYYFYYYLHAMPKK